MKGAGGGCVGCRHAPAFLNGTCQKGQTVPLLLLRASVSTLKPHMPFAEQLEPQRSSGVQQDPHHITSQRSLFYSDTCSLWCIYLYTLFCLPLTVRGRIRFEKEAERVQRECKEWEGWLETRDENSGEPRRPLNKPKRVPTISQPPLLLLLVVPCLNLQRSGGEQTSAVIHQADRGTNKR